MIESYEFGKIVLEGKLYSRDVIIFPDRVDDRWWRRQGHELCVEDIAKILEAQPEILVVGTGYYGYMRVIPEVREILSSRGVELLADVTKKACEAYNRLRHSKTVAALHLTC